MLPFAIANIDLADVQDEVVDAVAQLRGEAEEGGVGAVCIPSVMI
jgi:hypothetical protein